MASNTQIPLDEALLCHLPISIHFLPPTIEFAFFCSAPPAKIGHMNWDFFRENHVVVYRSRQNIL